MSCGFKPFLLFIIVLGVSASVAAADTKPEELIARHLQSIGTPEARQSAKSRVVEGTLTYRVLVGGGGTLEGKAVIVSEPHKFNMLLKLPASDYHGEQFVSDGKKIGVAGTLANKRRSNFAEFLQAQNAPLREGLLGGVLTLAWPLGDLESRKASASFEGVKQVDGKSLEVLRYRPQKGTDLEILLYFDPETAHHVKTVYSASQQPTLAGAPPVNLAADPNDARRAGEGADTRSARAGQTRYRIEENFSQFEAFDGFTLPTHYELRFSEELQNSSSSSVLWSVVADRVLNNVSLDPRNFEVK